jgi:hypothetical protein
VIHVDFVVEHVKLARDFTSHGFEANCDPSKLRGGPLKKGQGAGGHCRKLREAMSRVCAPACSAEGDDRDFGERR